MSKAKTPLKVLRVALNRIQKGWTKGSWHNKDEGGDNFVCLEGAIYGFCQGQEATQAQKDAIARVKEIIKEEFPNARASFLGEVSIPSWNDAEDRVQEDVERVVKLAIIREETEAALKAQEEEFVDEVDELFDGAS